jgi:glyoxylase-like metal-dependent hydrolase (beta-lactamase superfamily II)
MMGMKMLLSGLALVGLPLAAQAQTQAAAPPAKVSLTRMDCGVMKAPRDLGGFSDTRAYPFPQFSKLLVSSCYLIRHNDELMVWDTGYPLAFAEGPDAPIAIKSSLADQLRQLDIDPATVGRVGISHYHGDHIGQAQIFSTATLLIGQGDWNVLTSKPPAQGATPALVERWISGGGKVEALAKDKDVFGDGTVTIIDTPGHTPGHKSLLVKLAKKGHVLLTGDLAHFSENYETNGVPLFNFNRADTLASLDRFKKLAANLKAIVIIQHEPGDVAKLPAFPAAAE